MKLESNPPFTVNTASYSHITGGLPGNNTLNLMIEFTENQSVDFQKVYFQNKVITAVIEQKQDKNYIAARYKTSTGEDKKDLVLNGDPVKEYGNTTKNEVKIPFELKENEAVVTYKVDEKIHYYKIKNIKKEKRVFMPTAKPQN
ncbi:hypothetical protein [Tenacibaculum haliotis]|uniref:hypothetical protein n=1 Tax=Tenacibaculum haliotis TaxID=1888914 RepID=UPI0021AEA3DF|nr:hypothetical protein [Tenacibaculum haliotis]MCT4700196.1 hypothetical protein [Tenacibaculum haliotis]